MLLPGMSHAVIVGTASTHVSVSAVDTRRWIHPALCSCCTFTSPDVYDFIQSWGQIRCRCTSFYSVCDVCRERWHAYTLAHCTEGEVWAACAFWFDKHVGKFDLTNVREVHTMATHTMPRLNCCLLAVNDHIMSSICANLPDKNTFDLLPPSLSKIIIWAEWGKLGALSVLFLIIVLMEKGFTNWQNEF